MGEYLRKNTEIYKDTETKALKEGDAIVITYAAKLKNDAVTTTAGEITNTSKLTLSTNPTDSTELEPIEKTANIYTFIVDLSKIDATNINTKLPGAKFTLKSGNDEIKFTKVGDYYVQDLAGTDELVTDSNGNLKIAGLQEEKTYTLTETVAPQDYSLPTDQDFAFKISTTDYTATTNKLKFDREDEGYTTSNPNSDNKTFDVTLKKAKAGFLPETGGMGTVVFTVVGVAVMATACTILVVRNRKNNED